MKIKRVDRILLVIILMGFMSLILENAVHQGPLVARLSHWVDFLVTFLFVSMYIHDLLRSGNKLKYLKKNIFETVFILSFVVLFAYAKFHYFFISPYGGHNLSTKVILLISLFNVYKVLIRVKKLNAYIANLTTRPAQTIMMSFIFVILVGTIMLMMPFSTADNSRIGFINSLFTATSATCVTGLIVEDTAVRFSVFGKLIIMALIQVGGLGIMILASFTAFLAGRKMSLSERMTISYVLEQEDARNISRGIGNIVIFTLGFELVGAVLLLPVFRSGGAGWLKGAFYSLFHSVSAFCNAGFALFPDNLVRYGSSLTLNFVVAGLIIAGGISFAVLSNSYGHLKSRFLRRFVHGKSDRIEKLNLNTQMVLITTAVLLIAGTLVIYKLEHRDLLLPLDLKTQYLQAFFQSVTLRTAGFNTMDISALSTATYSLMILFMFIGGASGSTAGGIKVNTVAVIWSYLKSVFNGRDNVVALNRSISRDLVNQAFLIMLLSLCVIFAGTLLLSLTDDCKFIRTLFEVTSAFGTVGLSTGITPGLSEAGRILITVIMFIGRLGPLTVVTAIAGNARHYNVRYPEERVNIG